MARLAPAPSQRGGCTLSTTAPTTRYFVLEGRLPAGHWLEGDVRRCRPRRVGDGETGRRCGVPVWVGAGGSGALGGEGEALPGRAAGRRGVNTPPASRAAVHGGRTGPPVAPAARLSRPRRAAASGGASPGRGGPLAPAGVPGVRGGLPA